MNNNIKPRSSGNENFAENLISNVGKYKENTNDVIDEGFSVLDLSPETHYKLRMTAHNSAGSTVSIYRFTTLTFGGATVAPELIIHSEYNYGFHTMITFSSMRLTSISYIIFDIKALHTP